MNPPQPHDKAPRLTINGAVGAILSLDHAALAAMPEADRVADVSAWDPARRGSGVRLAALVASVRPAPGATYLTLHASRDDFHASVPLAAVLDRAVVVTHLDGAPLPVERGGPFRLLIRDHAACQTDEVDDCANVKHLDRIELTPGPGLDTRPRDEAEHARLHGA